MSIRRSDFANISAVDIFFEILKRRICYYTKKARQEDGAGNMLGVASNGKLSLRLIRSKLRKREDSSTNSTGLHHHHHHTESPVVVTANGLGEKTASACGTTLYVPQLSTQTQALHGATNLACLQHSVLSTITLDTTNTSYSKEFLYSAGNSQLSLEMNDQETLVHPSLPSDESTNKKNFKGKLRKLVKRKHTHQESYTIPIELRDQLKQIYVY